MASGLIGGLPVTQVIVRSSANIQSGGQTKASAIMHGFLLLACAFVIPGILNLVPLASLAAILFLVGYKLATPHIFKTMYKSGMGQFTPFIVTILGIMFTNLLLGIVIGLTVAIIQILWDNYQTPYKHVQVGDKTTIYLGENVSFLNKARIIKTLNELPENTHVVIDGARTKSIHPDVLEIINDFKNTQEMHNIKIDLLNL